MNLDTVATLLMKGNVEIYRQIMSLDNADEIMTTLETRFPTMIKQDLLDELRLKNLLLRLPTDIIVHHILCYIPNLCGKYNVRLENFYGYFSWDSSRCLYLLSSTVCISQRIYSVPLPHFISGLVLTNCGFPHIPTVKYLKKLVIDNCTDLSNLEISRFTSLKHLEFRRCMVCLGPLNINTLVLVSCEVQGKVYTPYVRLCLKFNTGIQEIVYYHPLEVYILENALIERRLYGHKKIKKYFKISRW